MLTENNITIKSANCPTTSDVAIYTSGERRNKKLITRLDRWNYMYTYNIIILLNCNMYTCDDKKGAKVGKKKPILPRISTPHKTKMNVIIIQFNKAS